MEALGNLAKKYDRVLVAVDKSERSKLVYKRAIKVAHNNNARLAIVCVLELSDYDHVLSIDSNMAGKIELSAIEYLKEIETEAKEAGVEDVKVYFEKGDVKRTIVDKVAKDFDPDLIICGDRELRGIEYFMLLGSVSNYIIHKAKCDVLVVK